MGDFIALSMSGVWVGSSTSVKSGCQNEHTYLVEASKFCRSGWYDVTDTNTFKGAGCGTSMYGEYNYELATENKTENPDKKGTYATKCEYLYSE
jgi:hypothetical protein